MANLKKNIAYNFIYQILILFIPLIITPYLSRTLGASGIGRYSYSYSIALYFSYFIMLGLNNYGNRIIASLQNDYENRSKVFSEIYFMQIFSGIFIIIIYLFYIFMISNDRIAAIIQGGIIVSALFDINWFFFGMEEFKLTVTRNTIIKLITMVVIFIFVKDSGDLYTYIFITAISTLLSQLCLWCFLKRYVYFKKPSFPNIKKHFKPNLVLFIPVIAISVYKIIDKIMLGSMSTMGELGYYESAEKIISVPIALITAIGTVMLPRITSMLSNNMVQESKKYIDKTMIFVLAFANMAMMGIILVSKEFSVIYFGKEFLQSGIVMNYLSITIVFLACGNVIRTQFLIPSKKDRIFINSAILGAIVNVIINILLIPKYASSGAAIATIAAEFIVCFYQLFCVRSEFDYSKYIRYEIAFFTLGVFMYFIVKLIPVPENDFIKLLFHMVLGGVIYCVPALFLIKNFTHKLSRE